MVAPQQVGFNNVVRRCINMLQPFGQPLSLMQNSLKHPKLTILKHQVKSPKLLETH